MHAGPQTPTANPLREKSAFRIGEKLPSELAKKVLAFCSVAGGEQQAKLLLTATRRWICLKLLGHIEKQPSPSRYYM
ncbi:MAG: hypothetical protein FWG03_00420 [Clostridiales bacterium]|nr:hypothetical protein [Clostridiales bacterium]